MKQIPLTQGKFAIIDDEDFEKVSQYKWHLQPNRTNNFYAVKGTYKRLGFYKYKQGQLKMHRFILNAPEGMEVDHINGNGLDNRKNNLRLCKGYQNSLNRGKRIDNSSGFKGVHFNKDGYNKKWRARVQLQGKRILVGDFQTAEEAARAYDLKAKELFGEFARLNYCS